jgi:hypothetical protein
VAKPGGSLSSDAVRGGAELVAKIRAAAAMNDAAFLAHRAAHATRVHRPARRAARHPGSRQRDGMGHAGAVAEAGLADRMLPLDRIAGAIARWMAGEHDALGRGGSSLPDRSGRRPGTAGAAPPGA